MPHCHPANTNEFVWINQVACSQPCKAYPCVHSASLQHACTGTGATTQFLVYANCVSTFLIYACANQMKNALFSLHVSKVGDGGAGGGILLADTWWDKEALSIAEEVAMSFQDLKIYAFKTSANSNIRVRIEKLSNKYGSPNMADIGDFSSDYRVRLDEAIVAGKIPENISLEVSSPGVERVVRVPDELERFKEKPMYVRYAISDTAADSPQESDGVFRLISFDLESCHCTWGIADVKANRNQAGKGRPLNKKQREWRLETPFDSLRLVRVHSDC